MPVKDSIETCKRAVEHLMKAVESPSQFTLYNDFSTAENSAKLTDMAATYGFNIIHWAEHTNHPSPNYLLTLQRAQQEALTDSAHLLIVESDVLVESNTIVRMLDAIDEKTGMVAAVTVDEAGNRNFPYQYAQKWQEECVSTQKRLSFCCTLISHKMLQAYNFALLDATKNWYDVFISHKSLELGFTNYLLLDTPVVHLPHSSRPWKQLKYSNPLLYYWRKITQKLDKI